MYTFYYEQLEVWQNARKLVKDIYPVSRNTNQIRRASTGIMANIAEGTGKNTNKDKSGFISILLTVQV